MKNAGTWLLLLLPNNYKGNEAGTSSMARNRELWESGMNIVMDTLSVAAGNTAKDKRVKEASNRSQARGPIPRKTRLNAGKKFSYFYFHPYCIFTHCSIFVDYCYYFFYY